MDRILIIAGCALLAFAVFGGGTGGSDPEPVAAKQLASASPAPSAPGPGGAARVTVPRAADGHFYADVRINNATVRMLVDTGASTVLLTREDARRAGIRANRGEFTAVGQTAGGDIALKPVTIRSVAIGPVRGSGIPAMVAERDVPISLLGQSFLERVAHVEIAGDELRLR